MNIAPLSNIAPLKPKRPHRPLERPLAVHPLTTAMMVRYGLFAVELFIAAVSIPILAVLWGIPRGIGLTLRDGCVAAWDELSQAWKRCGR
jgi:hypothetical protein